MNKIIIPAGPFYLDIDAYACIVAMTELLHLKEESAIAYSNVPHKYSIFRLHIKEKNILKNLQSDFSAKDV